MLRRISALLFCIAVLAGVAIAQPATQQPAAPQPSPQQAAPQLQKTHLKVGQAAPDFTLRATDGKTYKLSDFKGQKNVVLAAYVLAFTGG